MSFANIVLVFETEDDVVCQRKLNIIYYELYGYQIIIIILYTELNQQPAKTQQPIGIGSFKIRLPTVMITYLIFFANTLPMVVIDAI